MITADKIYPQNQVSLREVGLRDGLQMVKTFPNTKAKKAWISLEYDAGVRHFEVGSFLPKDKYPMFADVVEIADFIKTLPGAHGAAVTLNKRGIIDALESGVAEISCVVSASEEHNQANTRRSRAETLIEIQNLCRMRDKSDNKPLVSVGIAMSFGCSIAGKVDPKSVMHLAEQCFIAGADLVSLADTVGYAGPNQVAKLTKSMSRLSEGKLFGIHLHDTRGLGIANASAALDEGVCIIDAAMGGLGGCPFAPGATGNIVFEDLVFLCQTKGINTGINLEKLNEIRDLIQAEMPTEKLYGGVAKAGRPLEGVFIECV